MIDASEITDIDWENPDVRRLIEFYNSKFVPLEKENARLNTANAELNTAYENVNTENIELRNRIIEMEKLMLERSRSTYQKRSYNTRTQRDYPRSKPPPKPMEYVDKSNIRVIHRTVDQQYCPQCGCKLSKWYEEYPREVEDIVENMWTSIRYTIVRRHCKSCKKTYAAMPENTMPSAHFGNEVLAFIAAMRCTCLTFGQIQEVIHMLHRRYLDISTLQKLNLMVADKCRPIYDTLLKELKTSGAIGGDETGWFFCGKNWWVWVFVSSDTVLYCMSPTRSKAVSEAILEDYDGIILSDSYSAWNDVGGEHQKCLLHYFRDMARTRQDNTSSEFWAFFEELTQILKKAIGLQKKYAGKKYEGVSVPESSIRKLQKRIDRLAQAAYEDADCKRYAKRLKREGKHLLTFLKHGINYHNNDCERSLRQFAVMRKIQFGNRSMAGVVAVETMASIRATCKLRGINTYRFIMDVLNGAVTAMPQSNTPVEIRTAA